MSDKVAVTLPRAVVVALGALLLLDASASYYQNLPSAWNLERVDFNAYYWAGKRIYTGQVAELYAKDATDEIGQRVRTKQFKNLPIVGVPFVPFGRLPFASAARAWWIASALFAAIGFLAACRWLKRRSDHWLLAACILFWASAQFYPVHRAFLLGQTTQLAATLLFLGYLALGSRREVLGGIALGLCALIKIPVTLFGVFLLSTRRWRALAAFVAVGAAAAMASVAGFGWEIHRVWLEDVIGVHGGTVFTAVNNQSFASQAMRLVSNATAVSYDRIPLPTSIGAGQWILVAAISGAWIAERRRLASTTQRLDLDFVLCIALLPFAYPIFWVHYFVLSLVALLIFWKFLLEEIETRHVSLALLSTGVFLLAGLPPFFATWFYGRETELWPELLLGRFLYSSALLIALCFVAARSARVNAPE